MIQTFLNYGDLQLVPEVDQLPHLGVPYPPSNGGQQLRHASGRCPLLIASVTCIGQHSYLRANVKPV